MKKCLFTLLLSVFVFSMLVPLIPVHAQTWGQEDITDGKEYWFGIPQCLRDKSEPVRWGKYPIELWISSKFKTRATIESLDGSITTMTYNISPNEIKVINIPDFLENTESEKVTNKGIHIVGDLPISVGVLVAYKWSGEAYRVTPVEWLGKKYFTLNMYQDDVKMYSGYTELKPAEILIIATKDKTNVTYSPKAETEKGIKKGSAANVKMNKGQTFLIKAKTKTNMDWDWSTDLSGTKIEASAPVACISGHTKAAFPRFSPTFLGSLKSDFMRNMLMDMMWPVELLGNKYVSAPIKYLDRYFNSSNAYPDIQGDLIRFVATKDNTIIYQMRADGTTLKQISPILKEGEWYDITDQEKPAYYEANYPVLAGQYGKAWWSYIVGNKENKDTPQNPSWNGQGMMFCLTPIEQWTTYATFRSVVGMDDFLYLTFRNQDLKYIYFDGALVTARFGTAIQAIPGTEYGYITVAIPAGDHYVKATDGARFAGYAYGNWDSAKDGFAYGYPIGINYTTPCVDTLSMTDSIYCGNVVGTTWVEPADSSCAKLYTIVYDSLTNYDFRAEQFDPEKDKLTHFYLDIIDPRLPASGKITIMARSGKNVTKWYYYEPEQIVADPNTINYGTVKLGDTKCVDVILKNPGKVPTTVKELKFKYNKPEFKYVINGLPTTIPAGGQQTIQVCGTALELRSLAVEDTIIAVTTCYEDKIIALKLLTNEPVVWIDDADWGALPIGVERPRTVQISNRSQAVVELTSMDWADHTHFTRVEGLNFPITIDGGRNITFTAYYKPDAAGERDSTTAFFVGNTTKIKLYSAWAGIGTEAGPAITGFDWLKKRVLDNFATPDDPVKGYHGTIVIDNTSITNTDLNVDSVQIINDFGGSFTFDKTQVPKTLKPHVPITLDAWFKPVTTDAVEEYQTDIVLWTKEQITDRVLKAKDVLHGIETQPHVSITDIDFGPALQLNDFKDDFSTLKAEIPSVVSQMDLKVFGLSIDGVDKDAFKIDPVWLAAQTFPFEIPAGTSIQIPVRFTALHAGLHNAQIIPNDDAPEEPIGQLIGRGFFVGIETTNKYFGRPFITLTNSDNVSLTNVGSEAVKVNDIQVAGNDANNFQRTGWHIEGGAVNPPIPFDLGPNEKLVVDLDYTPLVNRIGDNTYTARVEYETSLGKAVSNLTGDTKIQLTRISIPKYSDMPGKTLTVDVMLENHPDETKPLVDANVLNFKAYINFKPSSSTSLVRDVYPSVSGPSDIKTAGTLTEGWNVVAATVENENTLYVNLESNGRGPLTSPGVLFRFDLYTYLSDLDTIPLIPSLIPINTSWVFPDAVPGSVIITPVCVNSMRLIKMGVPYALDMCTPNPVKDRATIEYAVGLEAQTTITLYNSAGEKVATLVDQVLKSGFYEVSFNIEGLGLPSGAYLYRMESGPFKDAKQMMITR
jgi:hypothetical protein